MYIIYWENHHNEVIRPIVPKMCGYEMIDPLPLLTKQKGQQVKSNFESY